MGDRCDVAKIPLFSCVRVVDQPNGIGVGHDEQRVALEVRGRDEVGDAAERRVWRPLGLEVAPQVLPADLGAVGGVGSARVGEQANRLERGRAPEGVGQVAGLDGTVWKGSAESTFASSPVPSP